MELPFVGPTYSPVSINIDVQRSINWYPEVSPVDAKEVLSLVETPGTVLFCHPDLAPLLPA